MKEPLPLLALAVLASATPLAAQQPLELTFEAAGQSNFVLREGSVRLRRHHRQ